MKSRVRRALEAASLAVQARARLLRHAGVAVGIALAGSTALLPHLTTAQVVDPPPVPEGLKGVPRPLPSNLSEFVTDRAAAIRLGKALFWDMQVGSDGKTACASCHFNAGADTRSINQISPGFLRVNANKTLNPDATFQVGGPNYQLKGSDFPFHKLSDPQNRNSAVLRSFNDIASSQGVLNTRFGSATPGAPSDTTTLLGDALFQKDGLQTRRVEPRNTPSMINAIFNFRNFWDGRATYVFNGVSPFGPADANARVYRTDLAGVPQPVQVRMANASLASLATGPVLSDLEMSAFGRTWPQVGRRLLTARALAQQPVHATDSALAAFRHASGVGLSADYLAMVKAAFRPEWWNSAQPVALGGTQFTQAEANFSLFFGLAIQLYGSTLVSDDSPFDRFMAGNATAMSNDAKVGMGLFFGKGKCANCHGGAEFTNASVRKVLKTPMNRMVMGNGGTAVYDEGFYNIAITRTLEDISNGATNPVGRPMSLTALAQQVTPAEFQRLVGIPPNVAVAAGERIAVDGAFKTPSIRNVELTAPYFHNGGVLTLRQVVEFYNRGGNHSNDNIANLDADISPLGLTETEIGQLVAFMKSTTDERVRFARAPFDHPQIVVPNGHVANAAGVVQNDGGRAQDSNLTIPAAGVFGLTEPLRPFLDYFAGGSFAIEVSGSGLCMKDSQQYAGRGNFSPIVLATCDGSTGQEWQQEPVDGGFQLRSARSGLCMEVSTLGVASTADGASVILNFCNSLQNQVFNWSDGRLVVKNANRCVTPTGGTVSNGVATVQQNCSNTAIVKTFTRRSGGSALAAVSTTSAPTAANTPAATALPNWGRCTSWGGSCTLPAGATLLVKYTDPVANISYAIPAWGTLICQPWSFGVPVYGNPSSAYCEHMFASAAPAVAPKPPPAPAPAATTWVRCTTRGGVCALPAGKPTLVRYVDPVPNLAYQRTITGSFACVPATFSVPNYAGGAAYCEYQR